MSLSVASESVSEFMKFWFLGSLPQSARAFSSYLIAPDPCKSTISVMSVLTELLSGSSAASCCSTAMNSLKDIMRKVLADSSRMSTTKSWSSFSSFRGSTNYAVWTESWLFWLLLERISNSSFISASCWRFNASFCCSNMISMFFCFWFASSSS